MKHRSCSSRWQTFILSVVVVLLGAMVTACGTAEVQLDRLDVPVNAVGRIAFFRADDCAPCQDIYSALIAPLEARCGDSLEVKLVDVDTPEGYEAFSATEAALIGEAGRWDVPTVVIGDTFYIGEAAIRQELIAHLQCVFGAGGNEWPDVESLQGIAPSTQVPQAPVQFQPAAGGDEMASCLAEEASAVCESTEPLFLLYVTQADCDDNCDRTRYDLRYLRGVYPQMAFEERYLPEDEALVASVGEALGIPEELRSATPLVAVGDDYLVGDGVTLDALTGLLTKYAEGGASAFWYTLDSGE